MMDVSGLLDRMFPGGGAQGLPSFSSLGEPATSIFAKEGYHNLGNALVVCLSQLRNLDSVDVNDVLKQLRAQDFDLAKSFVSKALDVYFTHPDVISALSMGRTTLFPNERILEDIDYDLLEQVVNHNLGGFRDQQD